MPFKITALAACALALAACAPKPDPVVTPVYTQPSYSKLGTPICPGGYRVATTAAGETVCTPI